MDPRFAPAYTPSFAARLLDLDPDRVRRWMGTTSRRPPLLVRGDDTGKPLATFVDLAELFLVRELVLRGGWDARELREASQEAAERLGLAHPLANRKLHTDGRYLYVRPGEHVLQLRAGGQLAMKAVLDERLRVLEFADDDIASRWWPAGRTGGVVLDPEVSVGAPVVPGSGVETEVLYKLWLAEERDLDRVAWAYELDRAEVERAVDWHGEHFARQQAA